MENKPKTKHREYKWDKEKAPEWERNTYQTYSVKLRRDRPDDAALIRAIEIYLEYYRDDAANMLRGALRQFLRLQPDGSIGIYLPEEPGIFIID